MIERAATAYFARVAGILRSLEATDATGAARPLDAAAEEVVGLLLSAAASTRKVLLIGNGGSAAIASHMQMDLSNSVGIRALVFHDAPLLTALSNDHGYATAFERSIRLHADPGDLLIAISSSGRSENILAGVGAAAERGCKIITLSGFAPENLLRRRGHLNFYAASDVYGYVELAHYALAHFLSDCAMVSR